MEEYDLTTREGIDSWYIGAVENAVKLPLRKQLSLDPNYNKTMLGLYYGSVLSGLNAIRGELYKSVGMRFKPESASLDDIVQEIRGVE